MVFFIYQDQLSIEILRFPSLRNSQFLEWCSFIQITEYRESEFEIRNSKFESSTHRIRNFIGTKIAMRVKLCLAMDCSEKNGLPDYYLSDISNFDNGAKF